METANKNYKICPYKDILSQHSDNNFDNDMITAVSAAPVTVIRQV